MEKYNWLWRTIFASGLIALAVQQLFYGDFRPVILPPGHDWHSIRLVGTWIFSILITAAGLCIILNIRGRPVSAVLGALLLLIVIVFHIPYALMNTPQHFFVWVNPLKEFAFGGGAFVVAGTLRKEGKTSAPIDFLEKFIPYSRFAFAILLVLFGWSHFLYADFVATLIPNWIPAHMFWTCFAGGALIAGGLGIMIRSRLAALLTGIMLFAWFLVLHIPRAVASLPGDLGNEWSSVFEAFAYIGVAFILAGRRMVEKRN
ncbi:MAG: hypothetical protein JST19_02745 [Bacteroidetes bacterium]|nr:hypothetical protein [Bacteroidota bacterium]